MYLVLIRIHMQFLIRTANRTNTQGSDSTQRKSLNPIKGPPSALCIQDPTSTFRDQRHPRGLPACPNCSAGMSSQHSPGRTMPGLGRCPSLLRGREIGWCEALQFPFFAALASKQPHYPQGCLEHFYTKVSPLGKGPASHG